MFTGKCWDEDIQLYYFNARYYDATIGRFINVDPVQDGSNWYNYCNNNPLAMVDPSGLTDVKWEWAINFDFGLDYAYASRQAAREGNAFQSFMLGVDAGCEMIYDSLIIWKAAVAVFNWFMGNPDKVNTTANKIGNDARSGSVVNELNDAGSGANTFVGKRGSPIQIQSGTNVPTEINGTNYTGHALDQMQSRGITPTMVEEVIKNGVTKPGYDGATQFIGDSLKVIVNPNGSIKTVIPQ